MSFFHRFGSSLNLHPHYHPVVLDGVFSVVDGGEVSFHEAYELTADRVGRLEATVQRRVLRYFARRGLLDEAHAGDMLGWQGTGGFRVDAGVRIEGEDRAGVERLGRYCARPPFALEPVHTFEVRTRAPSLARAPTTPAAHPRMPLAAPVLVCPAPPSSHGPRFPAPQAVALPLLYGVVWIS